jgi:subtilisin family serine protease
LASETDESTLSLEEFIQLPTTVDFGTFNTENFKRYIEDKPYIKVGKELPTGFLIAYTNKDKIEAIFEDFQASHFEFFPKILSPLDHKSNTAAGITSVIEHPYLGLSGKGVIIGIVDTGIDYTKDVFRFEDGTSKITSIWDQTLDGPRGSDLYFGAEFSRDQINEALRSENPFDIVATKDTDGHGTFLASVAAGRQTDEYVGAAPGANLVIVKLRRANNYYIERFFRLPDEPNLYDSTDYLLGVSYIIDKAKELNLPVVICIGMGSNQGSHDGNSILEDYISFISKTPGYAVVTAAGNESNAKHHTFDIIPRSGASKVVGVRVGVKTTSFAMTIIGSANDIISIGITSPTGEVISRIPFRLNLQTKEELTLEQTTVTIGYYRDVSSLIFITFHNAKEGIWEVSLFGDFIISGEFNAYLPITGQVNPAVEFMKPVPSSTIVFPATSIRSITCGAYNSDDESLFISSSWGPTLFPRMSPDIVAPGVDVRGVYPTGYGLMTGTSVAAAIAAGAAAILMEWGIVNQYLKSLDGDMIRILLSSGCKRDEGIRYPNTRWGYGKLDLFQTFSMLAGTSVLFDQSLRQQAIDLLQTP